VSSKPYGKYVLSGCEVGLPLHPQSKPKFSPPNTEEVFLGYLDVREEGIRVSVEGQRWYDFSLAVFPFKPGFKLHEEDGIFLLDFYCLGRVTYCMWKENKGNKAYLLTVNGGLDRLFSYLESEARQAARAA
jgi:hypothetical protein